MPVEETPAPVTPLAQLGRDRCWEVIDVMRAEAMTDPRTAPYMAQCDMSWVLEGAPHPGYRGLFTDDHTYALMAGHLLTAGWTLGVPDDVLLAAVATMAQHRGLVVQGARVVHAGADDKRPLYEQVPAGALRVLVDQFYSAMCSDDWTQRFFRRTNMDRLKRHQALMINQLLGGPVGFTDEQLAEAHTRITAPNGRPLVLTDRIYARTTAHLLGVVWGAAVPEHISTALVVGLVAKRALLTEASRTAAEAP